MKFKYNNLCISLNSNSAKRAAYKYAKDRAAIASRWCWLTTQISEIEYRIRQHADLQKRLKESKGAILFEDLSQSVNGFRGQLPSTSSSTPATSSPLTTQSPLKSTLESPPNGAYDSNSPPGSARTRAAILSDFRKRKLVQTANLHTISKRAARSR
jgi:KAT8 regulatory NSL complex subunit 1